MYIPPLLLLVPEFAADYAEENNQLFDMICLRKYEKLDDAVGRSVGSGDGYVSRYAIGIVGSGWGNDGLMQSSRWIWRDRDCFDF